MRLLACLLALSFTLAAPNAFSRDTKHLLSIDEALASNTFQERLDPSIKLYFGDQRSGGGKSLGVFTTNKKTNAFNKSDEDACRWVFLSALLSLQERARTEGATKVANITSYYKKNTYKSNTQYECHAGAIMAGVALQGEMLK